jgi:hypothetical protein
MTDHAIETRLTQVEGGQTDLQALLADHAAWRREMQEAGREYERRFLETERQMQETDRMIKEGRRDIRELGKQNGGLGQKFGGFTEGMALPSMERRLAERFGTTSFAVRPRSRIGGEELEVDGLAYSDGGGGTACLVNVKSRLREGGIAQMLRSLERFPRFFPEQRGKELIGVLAAVDASEELAQRVLSEGLVLARIRDDVFELQVPEGYEPRAFPNPATPDA